MKTLLFALVLISFNQAFAEGLGQNSDAPNLATHCDRDMVAGKDNTDGQGTKSQGTTQPAVTTESGPAGGN